MPEFADLAAKLDAVVTHETCPACDNATFEVQTSILTVPVQGPRGVNLLEGLPCLVALCQRCGYARFHSTNVLEKVSSHDAS
jgi:predicted nucleic-acid-binding Zn-ribbon protein